VGRASRAVRVSLDIVERLERVALELEVEVRAERAPYDQATAAHWLAGRGAASSLRAAALPRRRRCRRERA
jgi:hypothetical protein